MWKRVLTIVGLALAVGLLAGIIVISSPSTPAGKNHPTTTTTKPTPPTSTTTSTIPTSTTTTGIPPTTTTPVAWSKWIPTYESAQNALKAHYRQSQKALAEKNPSLVIREMEALGSDGQRLISRANSPYINVNTAMVTTGQDAISVSQTGIAAVRAGSVAAYVTAVEKLRTDFTTLATAVALTEREHGT